MNIWDSQGLVAGRWECSVSAAGTGGPSAGPSGAGVGRCRTQGDGWRPVLRLPVGDHEVLFRFESIQVVQKLVINSVPGWWAPRVVTFGEYQDRAWAIGQLCPYRRATPIAVSSQVPLDSEIMNELARASE